MHMNVSCSNCCTVKMQEETFVSLSMASVLKNKLVLLLQNQGFTNCIPYCNINISHKQQAFRHVRSQYHHVYHSGDC